MIEDEFEELGLEKTSRLIQSMFLEDDFTYPTLAEQVFRANEYLLDFWNYDLKLDKDACYDIFELFQNTYKVLPLCPNALTVVQFACARVKEHEVAKHVKEFRKSAKFSFQVMMREYAALQDYFENIGLNKDFEKFNDVELVDVIALFSDNFVDLGSEEQDRRIEILDNYSSFVDKTIVAMKKKHKFEKKYILPHADSLDEDVVSLDGAKARLLDLYDRIDDFLDE